MPMVAACLTGIFLLLVSTEILGKYKILKGEYRRKFLHISAGTFIAFWPWLISWHAIQIIGLAMLAVVVIARYSGILSYHGHVRRISFGDIFLALAVLACSLLTQNKVFFMLAILQVALADGLAAIAGTSFGKEWSYKIFGYKKTIIGSMVFWIASAEILAAGLLAASNVIQLQQYFYLLLLLPPVLTLVESASIYGIDNLLVPVLTIAVLRIVQS